MIAKPNYNDAPDYCAYYFDLVTEQDLIEALKRTAEETVQLFAGVSADNENYKYAGDKWTIKQLLRHLVDCERVYTYRAMRFSRLDDTELPGFDENNYAKRDNTSELSLQNLVAEYKALREATIYLFEGMNDTMLDFKGKANNRASTARAWGWMAAGHNMHHCTILKKRYLKV
jgi:DinB superfamily